MMRDHWEMLDRVATSIGDSTATRGIVVFTDYRCEFCREFREVEVALKGTGATTEEPRFVYRLTPRSGDQVAAWAARAAWCSGQQSSFAQMHDHLSATTAWMSDTSAEAVVRSAAIADGVRFKECLTSVEAQSAIAADVALMRELGGTGTPFFAVPDIGTHLGVPDTVMVRRWHASVVAAY
jgi:protein-disulfide isomerase